VFGVVLAVRDEDGGECANSTSTFASLPSHNTTNNYMYLPVPTCEGRIAVT